MTFSSDSVVVIAQADNSAVDVDTLCEFLGIDGIGSRQESLGCVSREDEYFSSLIFCFFLGGFIFGQRVCSLKSKQVDCA